MSMVFPDFQLLYDLEAVQAGTEQEEAYRAWFEALSGNKSSTYHPSIGLPFWVVLRLRKKDFSKHLDYDEENGMWVPQKGYGELWGIVTTREQLEALIQPKPDPDPARVEQGFVFLVYKIRVKGQEKTARLLSFLASQGMIEKE